MDNKTMNRLFAMIAFMVSFATYYMTVQPSVPFWDCGEFTAATVQQQVPHPPGAPLFLMIGKIFHLLLPGDPGWRVNMVSVVASAFTILLLYLITVMVIRNFRKTPIETMGDQLAVYGSALVAALAYNFSDTFWFNGVESEVYASSSLFVQIVVYMMMRWNEEADNPGHEKYLLMIAYLIGLSTGVHLLSILAIFSIVYLVYFRKYSFSWTGFTITSVIAVIIFVTVYPGIVKWTPALLAGNLPFKNEAREYLVENNFMVLLLGLVFIVAVLYGVYYGYTKKNHTLSLVCSSFILVLVGYTSYTHILIRSNANPPMNENAPTDFRKLIAYLGREQYGDAPFYPRRYDTEPYKVRRHKEYGEWYAPSTKRVEKKDGTPVGVPEFRKVNTAGELKYLFGYQIDQMYLRYFFWNFVGRSSDIQDSPASFISAKDAEQRNVVSGYKDMYPIRFYALPLLFGLLGLFFHANRDKKMAWVYIVMFLMMGVLAAIQQNQQNPQPRERDYFYAGSFMVWCMWIGLGVYAIIDSLQKKNVSAAIAGGVVAASLVLVPVNMAAGGWKLHSRAGNYLPFDFAYNILQSCEKDAILFTNGDNDTFPLWYMQDVAGVRRDIRIVNLSLGNTLWYIDQLKNQEPWGAKKVPLSFDDRSLRLDETDERALQMTEDKPREIRIPVDRGFLAQYTKDTAIIASGTMSFRFMPVQQRSDPPSYYSRVQDKLVLNIMENAKFTRPIYFSTTVGYPGSGSDVFVGLDEFMRKEGMVYRVCPVRQPALRGESSVEPTIMDKIIMQTLPDDEVHAEPYYGSKFRNLNNPAVFYDEHHRGYLNMYRNMFTQYAVYALDEEKNPAKAAKILEKMTESISLKQFPPNYMDLLKIGELFAASGRADKAKEIADLTLEITQKLIANNELMKFAEIPDSPYYSPYLYASDAWILKGDAAKAKEMLKAYQQRFASMSTRSGFRLAIVDARIKAAQGNAKEALAEILPMAAQVMTGGQDNDAMFARQDYQTIVQNLQAQAGAASN